jgi:hypothetical protein
MPIARIGLDTLRGAIRRQAWTRNGYDSGVLKDTGLDHQQIWNLTPEQIEMLFERMGFEIETQMIEFFAVLGSEEKIMQIKRNSIGNRLGKRE